jgi:hypothetical protein
MSRFSICTSKFNENRVQEAGFKPVNPAPQTRALSLISTIAKALIDEYPTPDAGPLAEFVSTLAEILPRGEM